VSDEEIRKPLVVQVERGKAVTILLDEHGEETGRWDGDPSGHLLRIEGVSYVEVAKREDGARQFQRVTVTRSTVSDDRT
jgi:hypothetical protein